MLLEAAFMNGSSRSSDEAASASLGASQPARGAELCIKAHLIVPIAFPPDVDTS